MFQIQKEMAVVAMEDAWTNSEAVCPNIVCPWKPQIANYCDLSSHVQIYVLSESERTQARKRQYMWGAVYPAPSRRKPSIPSKHKQTFQK